MVIVCELLVRRLIKIVASLWRIVNIERMGNGFSVDNNATKFSNGPKELLYIRHNFSNASPGKKIRIINNPWVCCIIIGVR
jgi:hypothetical protein